jgi:hypothetical protein
MKIKLNWDAMGIATSIACAIHCALLPLILTSLPLFGINIIHNLFFEWGMIGLAFAVGSYSLFHGFIKHHRNYNPILIFSAGFVIIITVFATRANATLRTINTNSPILQGAFPIIRIR